MPRTGRLEGQGASDCPVKYLIRDRDGKYPAGFDEVLANAASPSCAVVSG
jgi:hypothetical protein